MGILLRIAFLLGLLLTAGAAWAHDEGCPHERAVVETTHHHAMTAEAAPCPEAELAADCCHASGHCVAPSLALRDAVQAFLTLSPSLGGWTAEHHSQTNLTDGEAPTPPPRPTSA